MKRLWIASLVILAASAVHAHHTMSDLPSRSAKCGWIEGESIRDVSNLSTFCSRWVPAAYRIRSAAATREQLWVETPAELAAILRDDELTTRTLLMDWLQRWKAITGYRTASVVLLRGHAEVAKAETTVSGDVVKVR